MHAGSFVCNYPSQARLSEGSQLHDIEALMISTSPVLGPSIMHEANMRLLNIPRPSLGNSLGKHVQKVVQHLLIAGQKFLDLAISNQRLHLASDVVGQHGPNVFNVRL